MTCAALLAAAVLSQGASCLQEAMVDPDVGRAETDLTPRFVPSHIRTDVTMGDITWNIQARDSLVSVGHSVDLWLTHDDDAVFLGLAPSCFGRSLSIEDPPGSQRFRNVCRVGSIQRNADALWVRTYVGGGWAHTTEVQLADVFTDTDGDGWTDAMEKLVGTQVDNADTDGDGTADPDDANPQVAPAAIPPGPNLLTLMKAALQPLVGCLKDRPFIVVAPQGVRLSLEGVPCKVLWFEDTSPQGRLHLRLLPLNGVIPRGLPVMEEAARSGGINRVYVRVVATRGAVATVQQVQPGGLVTREMRWDGNAWQAGPRSWTLAREQ